MNEQDEYAQLKQEAQKVAPTWGIYTQGEHRTKTFVATVEYNWAYSKARVSLVDIDTMDAVANLEIIDLGKGNTILKALNDWADARTERPLRILNFGYNSSNTLVVREK